MKILKKSLIAVVSMTLVAGQGVLFAPPKSLNQVQLGSVGFSAGRGVPFALPQRPNQIQPALTQTPVVGWGSRASLAFGMCLSARVFAEAANRVTVCYGVHSEFCPKLASENFLYALGISAVAFAAMSYCAEESGVTSAICYCSEKSGLTRLLQAGKDKVATALRNRGWIA